jgi:hypothetical protein
MKKMRNLIIVWFFVLCIIQGVSANGPAHGRFGETEGTCIVNGQNLHYWMYNAYSTELRNLRKATDLFSEEVFIPLFISYAEKLGWSVDYDNAWKSDPNNDLATSVKRMMQLHGSAENPSADPFWQGLTVSMTIYGEKSNSATLIINFWNDMKENYWWTYGFPLVK